MRVFVLLVVAACGAPPVVAPIANRAAGPDGYLIWSAPEQGEPTTRWVDASGRVVGTAGGIVIASGSQLYRLASHPVTRQLRTCDQIDNDAPGPPAGEMSNGALVSLEPVGGGEPIALNTAVVEDASELDWSTTVVGALGPYVFLEDDETEFACGAHGGGNSAARVFELEQRKVVAPLAGDGDAAQPAIRDRAQPALAEAASGFDGELHVAQVVPAWAKGVLAPRWLIWTETCYACTQGDWSSYTASTWLDGGPVPRAMAEQPPLPPAVAALLDGATRAGASWGTSDAAWRATFH